MPPRPEHIRELLWNDSAEAAPLQDGLYSNGYCTLCRSGVGIRTTVPIVVQRCPAVELVNIEGYTRTILLVSERLRVALERGSEGRIRFAATVSSSARLIYEILGDHLIETVGLRGRIDAGTSLVCPTCGRRKVLNFPARGVGINYAIRASEVPTVPCFLAGKSSFRLLLCLTDDYFGSLKRDFKRLRSQSVLLANDSDVDIAPVLGTFETE